MECEGENVWNELQVIMKNDTDTDSGCNCKKELIEYRNKILSIRKNGIT